MAIKLEIPTALRPFTGKQASVEFEAATVGEALQQADGDLRRLAEASLHRGRPHPQLREHLRERRGHPLPGEGKHAHQGRRHDQHRPVHRRRRQAAAATRAQSEGESYGDSNQHAPRPKPRAR